MRTIAIVVAGLTLLSVSALQAAEVERRANVATLESTAQVTDFSAAKRRKKHVRTARQPGVTPQSNFEAVRGQAFGAERAAVACTRSGCQGVPRGCLREPERSFNGEPTGFDSIVCPPR